MPKRMWEILVRSYPGSGPEVLDSGWAWVREGMESQWELGEKAEKMASDIDARKQRRRPTRREKTK